MPPNWPRGLCSRCALAGALDLPQSEDNEALRGVEDTVNGGTLPAAENSKTPLTIRFGEYELLEEVARGGMGVVYRARQIRLNRIVALKMILSGQFASKQEVLRFRGEAEAAASLHHPNIVAIHETGEQGGQHYFSMEYVHGRSLGEIVRDGPVHAQRAARYARIIAEAIHYAHQQGVLHRDLKPSNVLIDEQDRPRITDFGLAKRMRGDYGLTITGQVLGSPCFIAPEQTASKSGKVGPATDVYGIGAILYHLLTGRPPFQAETLEEILLQVRQVDPVPLRLLNPSVTRDLETICLKCLEKDPARRYPTAQALADELVRFLNDEPIHARPVRAPEKIWRWCRRKPVLAALIVLVHAVAALGLGGIIWQWRRAETSALGEWRHRAQAEAQAYTSDMNLVGQALQLNDLGRGLELLNRYRPVDSHAPDPRGWEWRYLWSRCQSDELATLGSHDHSVSAITFSPFGDIIASAGFDGKVKLWNPKNRELIDELNLGDAVRAIAISPDGRWLAALCAQRGCRLFEVKERREVAHLPVVAGDFGGSVAFAPDSNRLAVSVGHGEIQLWDLPGRVRLATLSGHSLEVKQVTFSRDGGTLYSASDDRTIRIWDVPTRRELAVLHGHTRWVSALALAPNESILVSGSADGTARVWDLATRRETARLTNHASLVWDVKFSPDGRWLATCGADQRIRLWDTTNWGEREVLKGHLNEVWALAFSPDGNSLASAGKDESVRLWSAVPRGVAPRECQVPDDGQFGSFAPGGLRFSLVRSNTVRVWDTRTLHETGEVKLPNESPSICVLGPGGSQVYMGFQSGELRTTDVGSNQERRLPHGHQAEVTALALSEDGQRLASAGLDHLVLVQHARTGDQFAKLESPGNRIHTLCFSRDGSQLAGSLTPEDQVVVWDLNHKARRWVLSGHKGIITGLAFSPDGRLLASGSWDASVRLWDVTAGRLKAKLRAHLLGVNGVAFSSDGRRLAAGTGDGLIKIWNVENQQEVLTLPGKGSMGSLLFLQGDETLVTASLSAVQLWPAPSLKEIDRLERALP